MGPPQPVTPWKAHQTMNVKRVDWKKKDFTLDKNTSFNGFTDSIKQFCIHFPAHSVTSFGCWALARQLDMHCCGVLSLCTSLTERTWGCFCTCACQWMHICKDAINVDPLLLNRGEIEPNYCVNLSFSFFSLSFSWPVEVALLALKANMVSKMFHKHRDKVTDFSGGFPSDCTLVRYKENTAE